MEYHNFVPITADLSGATDAYNQCHYQVSFKIFSCGMKKIENSQKFWVSGVCITESLRNEMMSIERVC